MEYEIGTLPYYWHYTVLHFSWLGVLSPSLTAATIYWKLKWRTERAQLSHEFVRIAVEHSYKYVKQQWSSQYFGRNLKIGKVPIGLLYRNSAILWNFRVSFTKEDKYNQGLPFHYQYSKMIVEIYSSFFTEALINAKVAFYFSIYTSCSFFSSFHFFSWSSTPFTRSSSSWIRIFFWSLISCSIFVIHSFHWISSPALLRFLNLLGDCGEFLMVRCKPRSWIYFPACSYFACRWVLCWGFIFFVSSLSFTSCRKSSSSWSSCVTISQILDAFEFSIFFVFRADN